MNYLISTRHKISDIRDDLASAITSRMEAEATVSTARATLARGRDHLAELMRKVDEARSVEAEAEQAEVERLHAAASAGEALAEVHAIPLLVARAEAAARPAQALVTRLEGELARHEAALADAGQAVNRTISRIIEDKAEDLANELRRAKLRAADLTAALDAFKIMVPPDRVAEAEPGPAVPVAPGSLMLHRSIAPPPRFEITPTIAQAMSASPTNNATTLDRAMAWKATGDAWSAWARALQTDPYAEMKL